ncbi:MAG: Asp-tRNA(Asn)/Glu-tRNA(Gln) amidotransferase subunit GatC, partial [Myxococcota bacterium]
GSDNADNSETTQGVRTLSVGDVRRIALLARLDLTEEQVGRYQEQLSAVLGHMDQLRAIDVSGVEPMSHPGGGVNRLDEDRARMPSDTLPTEALLRIAPATMGQFVQVPKVIGEGGGA